MYEGIGIVEQLWSGQCIERSDGAGRTVRLRTYPTPVQKRLVKWITAAGSARSFQQAGAIGADLLTHLFDQGVDELAEKSALYRQSRTDNGWDPAAGRVAVTLHTFLADHADEVRQKAHQPYFNYLKGNLALLAKLAQSRNVLIDVKRLNPAELDEAIEWMFEKFLRQRSLIGTPDNCMELLSRLADIGVQEIACLLDFGPAPEAILASLPKVQTLMEQFNDTSPRA
jgi:natural product biosynthesis luciferase-like monooxygenase protein